MLDVFERLNTEPSVEDTTFTVRVPSTRLDLEGLADLSEEVIRMLGYDRLPSTLPMMAMTEGKLNPKQRQCRFVNKVLLENGVQDAITYTLISTAKKDNAILSAGEAIELAQPMSEERRYIRPSILPSLLDAAAWNKAHGNTDINLYEISELTSSKGVEEHLAIVLGGPLTMTRWLKDVVPADFYTLKGLIEEIWFVWAFPKTAFSLRKTKGYRSFPSRTFGRNLHRQGPHRSDG